MNPTEPTRSPAAPMVDIAEPTATVAALPADAIDSDAVMAADRGPAATAPADSSVARQARLLRILVVLALLYTAQIAASLILPILVALLVSLMLAPLVRLLCDLRLPRVVATLVVVGGIVLGFAVTVGALVDPARDWMSSLPTSIDRIEKVAREWRKPILAATKATEGLTHIGELAAPQGPKPAVAVAEPSSMRQLLASFPGVVASILGTLFLTVVFLARGDAVIRKLIAMAPHLEMQRDIIEGVRSAQRELSLYVFTVAVVNLLMGATLALVLWLMGVDQPLLWGTLAALLNFTPFVGPLLMTAMLVFVGFGEFALAGKALGVPAAYLAIHLLESQVITPLTVGRRLTLDPLMVFLSLIVLGWLWGLVGLLIAVPVLTCCRILCERIPGWGWVAKLLAAE